MLLGIEVIGPLAFPQEKPDNHILTSESGFRLLLDLAPPSVSADGGVVHLWFSNPLLGTRAYPVESSFKRTTLSFPAFTIRFRVV